MKKFIKIILLMICLPFFAQGCIFVVGAAAGAAAIAVVYDHRTIANNVRDTQIANKVMDRIRMIPGLRNESHIEATVFNRVVLLTGEVPNVKWQHEAGEIAKSAPDVERVFNQITVEGPTSTLTRTSDSWITAKIKGKMLANDELKSGSIKVVTENGVVYLMGIVSRQQANVAAEIARQVSGVQKVIKIFQYKN
ncbi:MAG: BON domain-containing protein [Gammaproteobacteria bacterium]|nr:BON domain-containing protein [Gammaproteobacteria bacterium]